MEEKPSGLEEAPRGLREAPSALAVSPCALTIHGVIVGSFLIVIAFRARLRRTRERRSD